MKWSQRVRVHVSGPEEQEETALETLRGSWRSRRLTRLLGNKYGVLLLVPRGKHVESVEIVESERPPG